MEIGAPEDILTLNYKYYEEQKKNRGNLYTVQIVLWFIFFYFPFLIYIFNYYISVNTEDVFMVKNGICVFQS